ncbi:MAG: hypothetical protein LQ350_003076 [Teloschistes chrysophthalmus]|nr:MAG: hypothetical protein LQ350_003076 [Niorma chrysophthalma]
MPRYNPKHYNSRAYKPGHYSAYPRERHPTPRKIWRYTAAASCLLLIFLFLTTTSSSSRPAPKETAQPIDPFGRGPVERSEKDDEKPRWEEHEGWLVPFSDTITKNRSIAVLPPSRERPFIYTFYDAAAERDDQVKATERRLLQIWKRAWRAKGFNPVTLRRAETVKNPLYEKLKVVEDQNAKLWHEISRWLAWEQAGAAGALVDWLAVPMAFDNDDDVLALLRSDESTSITTYDGLGSGLLTGAKASIRDALEGVIDSVNLSASKSLLDILAAEIISTKPQPNFLAFYSSAVLATHYESISTTLTVSKAAGLASLAELITSHLHLTFLNAFSGIEVHTPHTPSSLILAAPALALANALTTCPSSPIPNSCPPNQRDCKPCSPSSSLPHPIKITDSYANKSTLFTINPVPHPYTLSSLLHPSSILTVSHIRRTPTRDPWVRSIITPSKPLSGLYTLPPFKSLIARSTETQTNLYLPAEDESAWSNERIESRLGFELPTYTPTKYSNRDLTALLAFAQREEGEDGQLSITQMKTQRLILMRSRGALGISAKRRGENREAVEAAGGWHLADLEAWGFVVGMGERRRERDGEGRGSAIL